jgi:uncharacterized protein YndB with AHSA1/START domain
MDPEAAVGTGIVQREVALTMTRDETWDALTRSERLSAWFGADVQIDPRPRGKVSARSPDGSTRDGVVIAADRPFRLVLVWDAVPDPDGDAVPLSRMEFTLQATDGGTVLTVIESALSDSGPRSLLQRAVR